MAAKSQPSAAAAAPTSAADRGATAAMEADLRLRSTLVLQSDQSARIAQLQKRMRSVESENERTMSEAAEYAAFLMKELASAKAEVVHLLLALAAKDKQHADTLAQLRVDHANEIDTMTRQHAATQRELQASIADLDAKLVRSQQFEGSREELEQRIELMASEVRHEVQGRQEDAEQAKRDLIIETVAIKRAHQSELFNIRKAAKDAASAALSNDVQLVLLENQQLISETTEAGKQAVSLSDQVAQLLQVIAAQRRDIELQQDEIQQWATQAVSRSRAITQLQSDSCALKQQLSAADASQAVARSEAGVVAHLLARLLPLTRTLLDQRGDVEQFLVDALAEARAVDASTELEPDGGTTDPTLNRTSTPGRSSLSQTILRVRGSQPATAPANGTTGTSRNRSKNPSSQLRRPATGGTGRLPAVSTMAAAAAAGPARVRGHSSGRLTTSPPAFANASSSASSSSSSSFPIPDGPEPYAALTSAQRLVVLNALVDRMRLRLSQTTATASEESGGAAIAALPTVTEHDDAGNGNSGEEERQLSGSDAGQDYDGSQSKDVAKEYNRHDEEVSMGVPFGLSGVALPPDKIYPLLQKQAPAQPTNRQTVEAPDVTTSSDSSGIRYDAAAPALLTAADTASSDSAPLMAADVADGSTRNDGAATSFLLDGAKNVATDLVSGELHLVVQRATALLTALERRVAAAASTSAPTAAAAIPPTTASGNTSTTRSRSTSASASSSTFGRRGLARADSMAGRALKAFSGQIDIGAGKAGPF